MKKKIADYYSNRKSKDLHTSIENISLARSFINWNQRYSDPNIIIDSKWKI